MKNLLSRNMKTINKGPTVDTSNLQPVTPFHMEFAFYNVTYIRGFNSMIKVVCAKPIMLWLIPTASKRAPSASFWKHFRMNNTHANG